MFVVEFTKDKSPSISLTRLSVAEIATLDSLLRLVSVWHCSISVMSSTPGFVVLEGQTIPPGR
jgi:hypothetical protein